LSRKCGIQSASAMATMTSERKNQGFMFAQTTGETAPAQKCGTELICIGKITMKPTMLLSADFFFTNSANDGPGY